MARKCTGCGAGFGPGQIEVPGLCPLCGTEFEAPARKAKGQKGSVDPDEYRSNVRELREELLRLRRGEAEAV